MSPVLMPDGSVVTVGGNSSGNFTGPLYTALRYTPSSNSWETLAPQAMRRGYHSSAVLLPDGRVFSAGDTGDGGGRNTNEIFSPPYLSAESPTITSAPSQVAHGQTFTIETPDTTSKAVLIRPGSATHTINYDERIVTLSTTATASGLTAVSPSPTVGVQAGTCCSSSTVPASHRPQSGSTSASAAYSSELLKEPPKVLLMAPSRR